MKDLFSPACNRGNKVGNGLLVPGCALDSDIRDCPRGQVADLPETGDQVQSDGVIFLRNAELEIGFCFGDHLSRSPG